MDDDLAEHLVKDKDNKFHGTSVAMRLSTTYGMTLSLYVEVQKIWERLTRSQEKNAKLMEDYRDLAADLRNKTRGTTVTENLTAEEIKGMLKGFIAKSLSMDEVDCYCIVAKDGRGVKHHYIGGELEIYGMLDFVKRKMFVDMARRSDPERHNKVTRDEIVEAFKKAIREEKDNAGIAGREA